MSQRYDVSNVRPQGGYLANRCAVKAQNDTLRPAEPLPLSETTLQRRKDGNEFEKLIYAELSQLHPDATFITESGTREQATLAAMAEGARIIIGGRLPTDDQGKRVGHPDILVAAEGGGYLPVDVKSHKMINATRSEISSLKTDMPGLFLEKAKEHQVGGARKKRGDLLQLAHYRRMLETCGYAAHNNWGAILGMEREVVWFDLDRECWSVSESAESKRSTMAVYDEEFSWRLDVIAVAMRSIEDPDVELLVEPVKIDECDNCEWQRFCREQLEEGSGHVSLLPNVGPAQWEIHERHGVTDRAALAALDLTTADLVMAAIDVKGLLDAASDHAPETPIAELLGSSAKDTDIVQLAAAGVRVVGDLRLLDRLTAEYSGEPLSNLPLQIQDARAAISDRPAIPKRGIELVHVPRADIEIDVDMEGTQDGAYLWGTLLSDRTDPSNQPSYLPFVTWQGLSNEEQGENFMRFWTWLTEHRTNASRAGRTFKAYCYFESAENQWLRKQSSIVGPAVREQVEAFIDSDQWVDMWKVWKNQLVTGTGGGLKQVATIAGFSWEVEDPGGELSITKYNLAVDGTPAEQQEARDWLLTYNRNDVEATLAVREWMQKEFA